MLAATVVAGILPPGSAGAALTTTAKAKPQAARNHHGAVKAVTLVTGDRLTVPVDDPGQVTVQRGPGRQRISFMTYRTGGHLTVIPSDALPLLQAGRLDRRLFDVTELLASGYDDARADLPLIVTSGTAAAGVRAQVQKTAGARIVHDLPAVNGAAVREDRRNATAFWTGLTGAATPKARTLQGGVTKVWLDAMRKPTLNESVPLIGAPTAWAAGFTGTGVDVAVLDTGIDATHPDLADRVVGEKNFTDPVFGEDNLDHVGHGTHVASTIAGSGAASGGKYKGVAQGAKLLDGKVCVAAGCAESWIIDGMTWAAAEQHAKVANLSLGGGDTPDIDPLEAAVNDLTARYGTLFVIAAGNDGADGTIESPGSADAALTVGAVTKQDQLAPFSSRGPRTGDAALKPDITAPGVDITAARSKDGFIGDPGAQYATISGTSMATPHVTGSAAILAQVHPDWTPAQLKAGLMASAKPNPAIGVFAQGAGRVDIGRGFRQTVTANPPSLSFGRQAWPHNDDVPITKIVTYHNYGTAPQTLNLAFDTRRPDGKPTATGMFHVSANTVTVPAGGEASVDVTADTRTGGPDGLTGGNLIASGGDTLVQTPMGVDKEVESYDLTLVHTNRAGQPATGFDTIVVGLDQPLFVDAFDPSGTAKMRLPKGHYLVFSMFFDGDATNLTSTVLTQPRLALDRSQQVDLDARRGKPISVGIPRADAMAFAGAVGASEQVSGGGPFSAVLFTPSLDTTFTAQVGPDTKVDGFTANVFGQWAAGKPDGTVTDSPYVYNLSFFVPGRMPTGFHRRVRDRDLAQVRADYALNADALGAKGAFALLPGKFDVGFSTQIPFTLPFSRTEFYNTDDGVQWTSEFAEGQLAPEGFFQPVSVLDGPLTDLRPGRTVHQNWNRAAFGPLFPAPQFPEQTVSRTGDTILANGPLWSDGDGHAGFSMFDTARTTLFRDGTKVGESPTDWLAFFTVPPGDAQYRLETVASRGAPFALTTQVSAAWTFHSAHTDPATPVRLPLSVVRFHPPVDNHNAAPAGSLFVVPVEVQRQPGSPAARVKQLTVQVSFDDGKTWQSPVFVPIGNGGILFLRNPGGAGFVSLRASATDTAGNTVDETIIRAYRTAPR